MIEKHFLCDNVVREYEFDFGFCMPKSVNSVEFIYDLPRFDEAELEMILH